MQLVWLDLVVMILVDLTESCIDELICEWCTDAVFRKELGQPLAQLLEI